MVININVGGGNMKKMIAICFCVLATTLFYGCGESSKSSSGGVSKPCTFSPSGLNFGNIQVGMKVSADISVTCTENTQLVATWEGNNEYTVEPLQSVYSINANQPFDITVATAYTSTGGKTSAFNFVAGNGDTYQYLIVGNGIPNSTQSSLLEFSQNSLNFSTSVGAPVNQSIMVTNRTSSDLFLTNEIIINGDSLGAAVLGFSKVSTACNGNLSAGASCSIIITYTPQSSTPYTGNLVFSVLTGSAAGAQVSVPITVTIR